MTNDIKHFTKTIFSKSILAALALSTSQLSFAVVVLEEVIVTATKRAVNQQDVPVSVAALSADALAKRGITETTDLSGSVPNLVVSSPFGRTQPNFSIRGISVANEFNSNAASPIGVYINEDYKQFRTTHGAQLFDLERIEIIRGPQGTLFGRNTTGGAVSVTTVKPDTGSVGEFTGFINTRYGNFDRKAITGAIETSLIEDVLAVRLAGTWNKGDGYIKNKTPSTIPSLLSNFGIAPGTTVPVKAKHHEDFASVDDSAARLTVVFEPTDDFDATFVYLHAESEPYAVSIAANPVLDLDANPATPPTDIFGYSRESLGLGEGESAGNGAGLSTTSVNDYTLTMNWQFSDSVMFTSITGYQDGDYTTDNDCDGLPVTSCQQLFTSDFDQFNQDFRISWEGDNARFIAGIYYGEDAIDSADFREFLTPLQELSNIGAIPGFNPPIPGYINEAFLTGGASGFVFAPGDLAAVAAGTLPINVAVNKTANAFFVDSSFSQERDSQAIYFEGSYDFTDALTLTLGLRYTEDDFELTGLSSVVSDLATHTAQFNAIPYLNPYQQGATLAPLMGSSEEVTGRIILNYQLAEDVMTFVSYSRGYRAGTFNGIANQDESQAVFVEPEFVDNYEVGIKSRFLDNTVQLNATLYMSDYKDQQVQEIIGSTSFLRNVSGTLMGAEIELEWQATDTLYISSGLGFSDSEYDSAQYFTSNTNPGNIPCSAGPSDPNFAGNCIDIDGNQFPFAPETSANIFAEWTALSIDAGELKVSMTARYQDQIWFDSFNDDKTRQLSGSAMKQDAYALVDGRVSFGNDDYNIALWGKNLTDKYYNSYGIDIAGAFGLDYLVPGEPRTYGIDFGYKF